MALLSFRVRIASGSLELLAQHDTLRIAKIYGCLWLDHFLLRARFRRYISRESCRLFSCMRLLAFLCYFNDAFHIAVKHANIANLARVARVAGIYIIWAGLRRK